MSEQGIDLLNKLFYSSGEGIIFFSDKGTILTVNPRAESMFRYKEEDLRGEPVEKLIPSKYHKAHVKSRNGYIKNPTPRQMGSGRDLEGLRSDDTTFPLEISLSFLEHDGHKMVVAFITDITTRKENEKKLEDYTNSLEVKVRERTSELEHLNLGLQSQIQERKIAEEALRDSLVSLKKAEQEILQSLEKEKELNELKSRFVSMASHEFRTPLTTVLSSANLITKYTDSEQQQSREKHVDRIKKSVQNLTIILNDFLSIEKLESGAMKVEKAPIELDKVLEEIFEEMNPTLKEGQMINFEKTNLKINTDQHLLKNIMINLVSNASKYSNPGDPIDITGFQKNSHIELQCKDHGIGIPKSEQKNMFQRFFRAGNVTNIQGTGLGLTIVKKYMDLLGGDISFESKQDEGSTFTLHFPL